MTLYQSVTDRLLTAMESAVATGSPWRFTRLAPAKNYLNGTVYRGINAMLLMVEVQTRGLVGSKWLTFNQARDAGYRVKKGAKGVPCVKYVELKSDEQEGEGSLARRVVPKGFFLFHSSDIDGLPEEAPTVAAPEFTPDERAEQLLQKSGAKITWQGQRAFYRVNTDEIYMPERNLFDSPALAYMVACHELTHWTGAKHRLDREFSQKAEIYAFEELVAEIGSAFLCAELGYEECCLMHHANYLNSYIQILKNDNGAILRAASLAQKACDYLLMLTSTDEEKLAA